MSYHSVERKKPSILFLLKKSTPYYDTTTNSYSTSSGLSNSAKFVVDMLRHSGITTHIEQVVDNNSIDRFVTKYRPTHVIIEALWVVPEKFSVLQRLHPHVKWIVRYHSEIPFLALEGVAMEWTFKYLDYDNVSIAFNAENTHRDVTLLASAKYHGKKLKEIINRIIFLPNYYPITEVAAPSVHKHKTHVDVGCFGAIRPLKNQLTQAVAAITFAKKNNIGLRFHINGNRIQQKGDVVIKNIRGLFASLPDNFELVEYPWLTHENFIKVVRKMDIGLQMSFTETFNIVSADFVANKIPVVTSSEIEWVYPAFTAKSTDVTDIVDKMEVALWWKRNVWFYDPNLSNLKKYCKMSKTQWVNYFN